MPAQRKKLKQLSIKAMMNSRRRAKAAVAVTPVVEEQPNAEYVTFDSPPENWLGQECSICLDEFNCNQEVRLLKCLCKFHSLCIDGWLGIKKGCPVHFDSILEPVYECATNVVIIID